MTARGLQALHEALPDLEIEGYFKPLSPESAAPAPAAKAAAPAVVDDRPDTPNDWRLYNGHWYTLTKTWSTWEAAEAEAVAAGGHLVTINDADENAWLTKTFADAYSRTGPGDANLNAAWIGYCLGPKGQWEWTSGEPVTFKSLFSQFPNGGVHCYICLCAPFRRWDLECQPGARSGCPP